MKDKLVGKMRLSHWDQKHMQPFDRNKNENDVSDKNKNENNTSKFAIKLKLKFEDCKSFLEWNQLKNEINLLKKIILK